MGKMREFLNIYVYTIEKQGSAALNKIPHIQCKVFIYNVKISIYPSAYSMILAKDHLPGQLLLQGRS